MDRKRERKRETHVFCILDQNVDICNSQQERKEKQSSFLGREYTHTHAHFSRVHKKRKCPLLLKMPFTRLILLLLSADAALLLAL